MDAARAIALGHPLSHSWDYVAGYDIRCESCKVEIFHRDVHMDILQSDIEAAISRHVPEEKPKTKLHHNIQASKSSRDGYLVWCDTCSTHIYSVPFNWKINYFETQEAIRQHLEDARNKENQMPPMFTPEERFQRETIRSKQAGILLIEGQIVANQLENKQLNAELKRAQEDLEAYREDLKR